MNFPKQLDYTEQSSWLLFLKYLDSLEHDKATEAELEGKKYSFILDPAYRWSKWAAPKTKDGEIDHNKAQTGDDLRDFVNLKLLPYLHGSEAPNILHTVLDCPGGTFLGAGVKTVVLFFDKGAPTRIVWFYQLDPGRNIGKTNPLAENLAEFIKL